MESSITHYAGYTIQLQEYGQGSARNVQIFDEANNRVTSFAAVNAIEAISAAERHIDEHIAAYDPSDCEGRYQRVAAGLAAEIVELKENNADLFRQMETEARRADEAESQLSTAGKRHQQELEDLGKYIHKLTQGQDSAKKKIGIQVRGFDRIMKIARHWRDDARRQEERKKAWETAADDGSRMINDIRYEVMQYPMDKPAGDLVNMLCEILDRRRP